MFKAPHLATCKIQDKILLPLIRTDLEKKLEDELKSIESLTPGDFRVVKSKFQFKVRQEISHKALIAALKDESKLKQIHSGRKAVGF